MKSLSISVAVSVLLGWAMQGRAQWITQANLLKPGWNAVYLHVDASHADLDELVGNDPSNPIEEIWLWQSPLPTGQFIDSPQVPTGSGSQWVTWIRAESQTSDLQRLRGNAAYLVRVGNGVTSYTWNVKGKPLSPTYQWTLTGLNFLGFPTPSANPPSFESFLAPAPELQQNAEIYRYQGGELGDTNPVRVFAFRTTPVLPDQAYWVRAGQSYNEYFGPIQLIQSSPSGIRFGDTGGQVNLRLRNVANTETTVTLQQLASETAPAGQPAVQGEPPLLLRGSINTTNLTFGYANLAAGPQQWTLQPKGQPGSEVEIVIGLNRFAMTGNEGDLFAGILRFTDDLGLSQVDVAVSAEKASTTGLWVGGAVVSSVHQYLKTYAQATNAVGFTNLLLRLGLQEDVNGYHYEWNTNTGRVLVFGGPENKTGSYLLDGPVKLDSGTVARPYPLRLIVHNDGSTARLLQKVFYGLDLGSNAVLTTKQDNLNPSLLAEARRISAVHLPVSAANIPWDFTGVMAQGGTMTATVPLAYDDQASNPFLHTYHPDHDNLDPLFEHQLDRGEESYGIGRQITLTFTAPEDDFDSLTGGSQDLSGNYAETVTFLARGDHTQEFNVQGSFSLKRISDIAVLTQ